MNVEIGEQKLPFEIAQYIVSYLNHKELKNVVGVNKQWKQIAVLTAAHQEIFRIQTVISLLCEILGEELSDELIEIPYKRRLLQSRNLNGVKQERDELEKEFSNVLNGLELQQLKSTYRPNENKKALDNNFLQEALYSLFERLVELGYWERALAVGYAMPAEDVFLRKWKALLEVAREFIKHKQVEQAVDIVRDIHVCAYRAEGLHDVSAAWLEQDDIESAITAAYEIPITPKEYFSSLYQSLALEGICHKLVERDEKQRASKVAQDILIQTCKDRALLALSSNFG